MNLRDVIATLLIAAHPLTALSQRPEGGQDVWAATDSLIHLGHADVTARRTTSSVKTTDDGAILWNTSHLDLMPRIMGNADPIHYSQLLPGIQSNNEYHSSINIQGCDNAHSIVSIGRVPLYNVVHLLGIFSTFNALHYPTITLRKTATNALHPARLGGHIDMQLPLPEHTSKLTDGSNADENGTDGSTSRPVSARIEAGLISSQGTLQVRPTAQTLVTLSGRISYVNLLYGSYFNVDSTQVNYSFGDFNATIAHRHRQHTLVADTYYGADRATFVIDGAKTNFGSRWSNNAQALHWIADLDRGTLHTTAYHTAYVNRFRLTMLESTTSLPAHIDEAAVTTRFTTPALRHTRRRNHPEAAADPFSAGFEAIYRNALPQQPHSESANAVTTIIPATQHGIELSLPLQYTVPLLPHTSHSLNATIGLRPTLYTAPAQTSDATNTYTALDPSLRIDYAQGPFSAALTAAVRHQYVFQTGFSDIGLPSEFWLLADANHRPQSARGLAAEAALWLPGRTWRITVDAYYKRLDGQIEYDGTLFSILTANYELDRILRPGHGHNWGASVMLAHPTGPLTGWIAYTFTRARRQFTTPAAHSPLSPTGTESPFPASHERPHEFNAVATYNIKSHWALSADIVAASGTPFTAPTSFYLLGGNIVSEFGQHNAYRLPPYFRTDVSASYKWKNKQVAQAVNLSVYNCTARSNAIFYTVHIRKLHQTYAYAPTSFFTRILPSLSYTISF